MSRFKNTIRVRWDDTYGGWVAWVSEEREWQPVMGCEDPSEPPTLAEACDCDPVTYLNPSDYSGTEVE